MLPISEDFLSAIVAGRRKMRGRIEILWSDPKIDTDLSLSANDSSPNGRLFQIANNVTTPSHKWFSLDSTTDLSGSFVTMPYTDDDFIENEVGWRSTEVSNSGGIFLNPPVITLDFIPRPILALKVIGDEPRAELPADFNIKIYEGSTLVLDKYVVDNTTTSWQEDISSEGILEATRMVLTITRWNKPGHSAKILEFFSAVKTLYEDSDIISLELTEESEVSNGSLPIGNISSNELNIQINNINNLYHPGNYHSPLYGLVKKNRKVRAWIGIEYSEQLIEWHPLGVFWSGDWSVADDAVYAEATCRDILDLMTDTTITTSTVLENTSAYELFEVVLKDFGLTEKQYAIDTSLSTFLIPYGWFTSITHREALRIVAEASLSRVYSDREGLVRITPFNK